MPTFHQNEPDLKMRRNCYPLTAVPVKIPPYAKIRRCPDHVDGAVSGLFTVVAQHPTRRR